MRKLLETFQELNLSNYGPDDVDQLNAWAIDAYAELSAIKAQAPVSFQYQARTGEWNDFVSARHYADTLADGTWPIRALYAAPVSEAKAQGVVMPPPPYMPGSQPTDFTDYELGEIHGRIAMWEEVKRLNAAPVQQVSVPVSGVPSIKCWSCKQTVSLDDRADADGNCPHCRVELDLEEYLRAMLAASPAAPAADTRLVEALDYQVLFDAIAAATSVYANGAINISVQAFRDALAAHRAKGSCDA